jgi:uncharacterized protein (DUF433 family)
MNSFMHYINIDRDIRSGKSCIKGTRITSGDILGWLAAGMSIADIISDFPELNEVQICVAITCAAQ